MWVIHLLGSNKIYLVINNIFYRVVAVRNVEKFQLHNQSKIGSEKIARVGREQGGLFAYS